MPKKTFKEKYSKEILGEKNGFKNPRNMIAGKLRDDEPILEIMKDCRVVKYGIESFDGTPRAKSEQLDICQQLFESDVVYARQRLYDLTDDMLVEYFKKWSTEYEIDGIIIDINDVTLRKKLGKEINGNPSYAIAYKGDFADSAVTKIVNIKKQISKKGLMKPVVVINPIDLNGATITNVFADNERFLFDFGIGIGSNITVKRAGMVIPRICAVEGLKLPTNDELEKMREEAGDNNLNFNPIDRYEFPTEFKNGIASWDRNKMDMVIEGSEISIIQKIVAFFEILKIEGISDSTVEKLYNKGYHTVSEVLELILFDYEMLMSFDGWGKRSVDILRDNINSVLRNGIELHILQHASSFFNNLGSKKLLLLESVNRRDYIPTVEEIIKIKGFKEISAENFINGITKFWNWYSTIERFVKIKETVKVQPKTDRFKGVGFVFTGFRDKESEAIITENGGSIQSGVSKNTTYLVMKEKGSGSSKEKKALEFGVKIMTPDELTEFLKNI